MCSFPVINWLVVYKDHQVFRWAGYGFRCRPPSHVACRTAILSASRTVDNLCATRTAALPSISLSKTLLDKLFRFCIQCTCNFIQEKNRRVFKYCSSNCFLCFYTYVQYILSRKWLKLNQVTPMDNREESQIWTDLDYSYRTGLGFDSTRDLDSEIRFL